MKTLDRIGTVGLAGLLAMVGYMAALTFFPR